MSFKFVAVAGGMLGTAAATGIGLSPSAPPADAQAAAAPAAATHAAASAAPVASPGWAAYDAQLKAEDTAKAAAPADPPAAEPPQPSLAERRPVAAAGGERFAAVIPYDPRLQGDREPRDRRPEIRWYSTPDEVAAALDEAAKTTQNGEIILAASSYRARIALHQDVPAATATAEAPPPAAAAPASGRVQLASLGEAASMLSDAPPPSRREAKPLNPREEALLQLAQPGGSKPAFQAHIGSYKTIGEAQGAWGAFRQTGTKLLDRLEPVIVQVKVAQRGEFVRLVTAGFADRAAAAKYCGELRGVTGYCQPVAVEADAPAKKQTRTASHARRHAPERHTHKKS
jgi:hypothetical protein